MKDQLHRLASQPRLFLLGWLKLNQALLLDQLGRRMLAVAVISVDAYPFLAFTDLQDTGIGAFWFHCAV